MGTQVEQRNSPPNAPPPGLNPLAKLGWQIRLNKYKPTARETEVLSKCFDDGRWYFLNGAVLSGAAAWGVTGMGRNKLKFIPRVFMTGVAASIGRDIGGRIAGFSCMKGILSLEGSPLRAELISILQEDYPDHPLLKTDLGRLDRPSSRPLSEPEDYAQEAHAPVSSKDWALEIEDSTTKASDWPERLGRGNGNDQEWNRKIPRIWEIAERKEALKKDDGADILADPFDLVMQTGVGVDDLNDVDDDGADILADPFDLVMQTGVGVDDLNDVDVMENDHVERRRSRMGAKERREYDRRRYEERHAQEYGSF